MNKSIANNLCKMGQGKLCCRYLVAGETGLQCAKLVPKAKTKIDALVAEGCFTAISNNCDGITELHF